MNIERRQKAYTEKMSSFMLTVAAGGALIVLLDPKIAFPIGAATFAFGGDGFSADLKGAVISAILIGGWSAVKEYWLGSSHEGVKQAESAQRIAEAVVVPAATLATAAAATNATITTQGTKP